MLHTQFQMNYNNEPEIWKRGNIQLRMGLIGAKKKRDKKAESKEEEDKEGEK